MRLMASTFAVCLLAIWAGCKLTPPVNHSETPNSSRREALEAASHRSAAYADSMLGVTQSRPDKVAQVMAANDITVGDVADYVQTFGWALVRAPLPRAHWAPAAPGNAPIAYYLFELRGAVADTALEFYLPGTAGALFMRVRAVDENDAAGLWSDVGKSNGAVLPGAGWVTGGTPPEGDR